MENSLIDFFVQNTRIHILKRSPLFMSIIINFFFLLKINKTKQIKIKFTSSQDSQDRANSELGLRSLF